MVSAAQAAVPGEGAAGRARCHRVSRWAVALLTGAQRSQPPRHVASRRDQRSGGRGVPGPGCPSLVSGDPRIDTHGRHWRNLALQGEVCPAPNVRASPRHRYAQHGHCWETEWHGPGGPHLEPATATATTASQEPETAWRRQARARLAEVRSGCGPVLCGWTRAGLPATVRRWPPHESKGPRSTGRTRRIARAGSARRVRPHAAGVPHRDRYERWWTVHAERCSDGGPRTWPGPVRTSCDGPEARP